MTTCFFEGSLFAEDFLREAIHRASGLAGPGRRGTRRPWGRVV